MGVMNMIFAIVNSYTQLWLRFIPNRLRYELAFLLSYSTGSFASMV